MFWFAGIKVVVFTVTDMLKLQKFQSELVVFVSLQSCENILSKRPIGK